MDLGTVKRVMKRNVKLEFYRRFTLIAEHPVRRQLPAAVAHFDDGNRRSKLFSRRHSNLIRIPREFP